MSGCLKNNDDYFHETGYVGTPFVGDKIKAKTEGFCIFFI